MHIHGILEPDPALYLRLRPNTMSNAGSVLGRRLVMEVDGSGCRPVVGQPRAGDKTLAVYGCSCTFGQAVTSNETFCSLLQETFATWRVENYGVPSYGGTQNLLHLQRNIRWSNANYVTFCWIPHHRLRNVADPSWIQNFMARRKRSDMERKSCFPRAFLDNDGNLHVRSISLPRWDLLGRDLADFGSDPYYLDLVCFSVFELAARLVKESNGYFFVTTLLGTLSTELRQRLDNAAIPLVDASVDGREYTNLPDDEHPNALAHRVYADRIRDHLLLAADE
jgi:hypothetical protein